jgi:hypothetical protein
MNTEQKDLKFYNYVNEGFTESTAITTAIETLGYKPTYSFSSYY